MKSLSLFDGLYEITEYESSGKLIGKYPTLKEAAEANNISCGKASQCANGKRKGVKGLVICYE